MWSECVKFILWVQHADSPRNDLHLCPLIFLPTDFPILPTDMILCDYIIISRERFNNVCILFASMSHSLNNYFFVVVFVMSIAQINQNN